MDNKAKSGSLSVASGRNFGGSAEKELEQKKQKHRERARAYYLHNKAHVLEKAKARYRQRRESQKKAEEQKRAEGQKTPASTGGVIGVPKGIGKAEVPKKYEGPPLLRVLEFVADKLAAQQAKA